MLYWVIYRLHNVILGYIQVIYRLHNVILGYIHGYIQVT